MSNDNILSLSAGVALHGDAASQPKTEVRSLALAGRAERRKVGSV